MKLSRTSRRLDPASLRLPLIALIDVVLFLLLYFIFAGSLAAEERELAVALKTEGGGSAATRDLQPQIVNVEGSGTGVVYRLGDRTFSDRADLRAAVSQLPREVGIVVRVADNAPVWAAAAAVQVCHDAGFTKISYVPAKE